MERIELLLQDIEDQKDLLKQIREKTSSYRLTLEEIKKDVALLQKECESYGGIMKHNERLVLNLRDEGFTLQKISDIYGTTRERIRQIESKAREKLRQGMEL